MIIKKIIGCMLLGLGLSQSASATVLTFDDITGGSFQNQYGDMPTYNGYNFSSTLDWLDLVGSNWSYGAHSGEYGILNNNSGVGTITKASGADFYFDGLWAKQWDTPSQSGGSDSLFGTLSGYNNGILVWSVNTGLNGSYEFYGPQAAAIDELRLGFGNNFLVDDITLSDSRGTVPEPASLTLLGLGLGLAGLMRRRKIIQA